MLATGTPPSGGVFFREDFSYWVPKPVIVKSLSSQCGLCSSFKAPGLFPREG
jgi:hypothetical protein